MVNIEKVNNFFLQYLGKMRLKVSFLGVLYSGIFLLIFLIYKNYTGILLNSVVFVATVSFLFYGLITRRPQNEVNMLLFNLYFILYLYLFLIHPYDTLFICGLMVIPFVCYFFNSIEDLLGNDTLHWGYVLYLKYGIIIFIPILVLKPYVNQHIFVTMEPLVMNIVRTLNIGFTSIMTLSVLYDLRTLKKASDFLDAYAVIVDDLTQIFNRKVLKKLPSNDYNVAFFDLDYFKNINDTYGHDSGDVVLHDFSQTVSDIVLCFNRKNGDVNGNSFKDDFVFFREGGEEFILLGKVEAGSEKFITLVRSIFDAVKGRKFSLSDNESVYMTTSVGIYIHEQGVSLEQGIINADRQIYQAKNAGRKCIYMENKVLI